MKPPPNQPETTSVTVLGALRYLATTGWIGCRALPLQKRWAKIERSPREFLEKLRSAKLARVLEAAQRAPYWRELPGGAPESLAQWPILTKSIVRDQGARMLAGKANGFGVEWCRTGGSTGEPLRVARDAGARAAVAAACLRGFRWHGIQPGDATVLVRGFDRVSLAGRLRCWAGQFRLVDPLTTRDKKGTREIRIIQRFGPRCLAGYPTALLRLAEMADGKQVRVPVVISTGEMLYAGQRRRLEDVFRARVAEYYGSNEVGGIAFECEQGSMHISEEHVWLETLDEDGRPIWEEPGRIVVTDLDNRVMPLIRYELGDRGVLTREPCPCGRSLLVLRELQGRRQDVLRNRHGDILPAIFFVEQSRHLRAIRGYRLVQENADDILVRYAPEGAGAETEAEGLRQSILDHLGAGMRVRTESCGEILLTPRGKTRLVVGLD